MDERVLNLRGIRDHLAPHTPGLIPRLTALLNSAAHARLSRRTVLKMLGTAIPVSNALPASGQIYQTFQISNQGGRIAFIVGGLERWVIDPKRFTGDPRTHLTRRKDRIDVKLVNAFYPGTDISANFAARIRRVSDGWTMELKKELGAFETSVDFLQWLQGLAIAKSELKLTNVASAISDAFRVEIKGDAIGEFYPRWEWVLSGERIGHFQALGETLASNRLVLALPAEDESSLLSVKPTKRTVIGFARGEHVWNLKPPLARSQDADDDDWFLKDLDNLFDRLTIEAAAPEGQKSTIAVIADAPERLTQTSFAPSSVLSGEDDAPFEIPLQNPRLAAVPTDSGIESAFLADYAPATVRAFGPGYSMSLRTTPETHSFELVSVNDKVENLEFNPEVVEVHAPVQGTITEPCVPFPDDQDVDLPATKHSSRSKWRVIFSPSSWGRGAKCLKMGELPSVKVVRPEDLLVLEFSFTNIVLTKGKDDIPRLTVPKDSEKPGTIRVRFPPQSITEQAFFKTSDEFPLKVDGVCMPRKDLADPPDKNCDPDTNRTHPDPTGEDPTPPPVAARMAGPSQLVFSLAPGDYLDYTIEGLLDWSKLKPQIIPYADGKPETAPPYITNPIPTDPAAPGFTALETPYRLYLSPNKRGRWKHLRRPFATDENRVELWHTRLGTRVQPDDPQLPEEIDEKPNKDRTVRAIWSPDHQVYPDPKEPCDLKDDNEPFRMSLSRCDRHELVRLTSDYELDAIDPCPSDNPQKKQRVLPVEVNQLMLTALGSFMNVRGVWDPLNGVMRVEEWINRSTMARDHYVKVVYKGYLFPLGHRASLIKVTERKFEYDEVLKDYVPYLRQRMFIVIRERVKYYPALGQPFGGRRFPFQRIEFTERDSVTPDLDEPKPINGRKVFYNFWPTVNRACFNFRFIGWDEQGPKHLTAPLIFVDNIIAHHPTWLEPVFTEYSQVEGVPAACPAPSPAPSPTPSPTPTPTPLPSAATCPGATRYINICGDPIAYGPSRKSGDTSFPTELLKLSFDEPVDTDAVREAFKCADQPPFYPAMEFAAVHIPPVEEFTGTTAVRDIRYPLAYLENGFDLSKNAAEIFAEMYTAPDLHRSKTREPLYLNFGGTTGNNGDRSGGLSTPNQLVVGLSRQIGLVGGSVKPNGSGNSAHHAGAALLPPIAGNNEALEKALKGEFDPFDFFGGALSEAKLLGVVKLADIIKVVLKTAIGNLGDAPQIVRNTIYQAGSAIDAILDPMIRGIDEIVNRLTSAQIPDDLKIRPELLQRLQPSLQELRKAQSELRRARDLIVEAKQQSNEKKLEEARLAAIAAVGHAVQAGKQLVDECRRVANDPLGALGLNIAAVRDRFIEALNDVRGLIDTQRFLEVIRTEIRSGLTGLQAAIEQIPNIPDPIKPAERIETETKKYLKQITGEIDAVCARVEKTLTDLQQELRTAGDTFQNMVNANLGPILSLTAQFVKDANELKDRYEQLREALNKTPGNLADPLNELLRLQVVKDAVGATDLEKLKNLQLTFQATRVELETEWKNTKDAIDAVVGIAGTAAEKQAILADLKEKGESLYARTQAALRSIHDLPDSEAKRAELKNVGNDLTRIQTILSDYTKQFSHNLLGAQREFLDILVQFNKLGEELRAQGVTPNLLQAKLIEIGKGYTVSGKYFAIGVNATKTQIEAVANTLGPILNADIIKLRDELVPFLADPFLENGLKAIDKLDQIRQRATYAFLLAESVVADHAAPFIAAYDNVRTQLDLYQTAVKTAAGTLRTRLITFRDNIPDVLRPAVGSLLAELITDLGVFSSSSGKIEDLPRLMQSFLRLRDQIVGVFTNPVESLQKLVNVQKLVEGFVKQFGIPTQIALSFDWKPPLKAPSWPIFEPEDGAEFVIRADALIDLRDPKPPAFNITGRLTKFTLHLLPSPNFINLSFDHLEFKSQNGGSVAVTVKIRRIEFGESLSFVAELAKILNPSSGPFLDIQPTGITAGFRFGWPMIPVGGMIMYNLNLFAGITLPFTGDPMRLRLGVSDRARPFLLAVGVYAGGGFLALDLDSSGIQKVEGALEFGAHVELNFFGVAKGHGSVMGGFYFSSERKYKQSGEAYTSTTLCGYVRASGELSILGLVSVSLDILVQVCYVSEPARVYGRATVKVEISILFFSATVEVTAEYTFAGSKSSSHHAVGGSQQGALPAAGRDDAPTSDPILSSDFRWNDFLNAFHD